jgi:hypothetical protein
MLKTYLAVDFESAHVHAARVVELRLEHHLHQSVDDFPREYCWIRWILDLRATPC